MIDRKIFFAAWRESFGPLKQSAVDTLNLLMDHWEGLGLTDYRQLAYIMGTAHGEVGSALAPVREGFTTGDAAARRHVAGLLAAGKIKVNYALRDPETGRSYYGRGLVQLTHKSNYQAMGQLLGLDLVNNPDLALEPGVAVRILVTGMLRGVFTGGKHRLDGYFVHDLVEANWIGARRIVNGTDKAQKFAELAQAYYGMLLRATPHTVPLPEIYPPPPDVEPVEPVPLPEVLPAPDDRAVRLIAKLLVFAAVAAGAVLMWLTAGEKP